MTFVPRKGMQLLFIDKLQRILAQGHFTSTYKFALINAISDIAVEEKEEEDGSMSIPMRRVSERFIELYWMHTVPLGETDHILRQNTKGQAAVISQLLKFREDGVQTLAKLKAHPKWEKLLLHVSAIIDDKPLRRLQTIGGEVDSFMYVYSPGDNDVNLNPGVAYCLRNFHPLIVSLARSGWIEHIRSIRDNRPALGPDAGLSDALFNSERSNLTKVSKALFDIQEGICFYCKKGMHLKSANADHFIPWSRYPRDIGFNFVLAHATCNSAKKDYLAYMDHLHSWIDRNHTKENELKSRLSTYLPCDLETAHRVSLWAYSFEKKGHSKLWERGSVYHKFEDDTLKLIRHSLQRIDGRQLQANALTINTPQSHQNQQI